MSVDDGLLDMTQGYLGFTDEQMEKFKNNPRNMDILSKMPELLETRFVIEVIEAYGCVCQHQAGQQIVINGDGSLATNEMPDKVCIYLLQSITPLIFTAQEFIYAGLDPNQIKFNKLGCFDVGVNCGGIGHVVVQFKSS